MDKPTSIISDSRPLIDPMTTASECYPRRTQLPSYRQPPWDVMPSVAPARHADLERKGGTPFLA